MSELNSGINLYEELDLAQGADTATISERLNTLEAGTDSETETHQYAEIGRAILLNAKKREMYDRVLADADSDPLTDHDLQQLADMTVETPSETVAYPGLAAQTSQASQAQTSQTSPATPPAQSKHSRQSASSDDSFHTPAPSPFDNDVLGQNSPQQNYGTDHSQQSRQPQRQQQTNTQQQGYQHQQYQQPMSQAGQTGMTSTLSSDRLSIAGRTRTGSLQWLITSIIIFIGVGFGSLVGWSLMDEGLPVFSFPIFLVVTHTILWLAASEMVWQIRARFFTPREQL